MAYNLKYKIRYSNYLSQTIEIRYAVKNKFVEAVQEYKATRVTFSYSGAEGKFTTIIGTSLAVEVNLLGSDIDYFTDFMDSEYDEWQVTAYADEQIIFSGFVLPDEGVVPFKDRPFNATITAVDGVGLLKDIPLRYDEDNKFDGSNSLIRYIAMALKQTGQRLSIRVYDNLFHSSFANRDADIVNDMFAQAFLEYRTFLKDATTFVDCYTALTLILKDTHRLFQWAGYWVIVRISLFQYWPFARYFTTYDFNGLNPFGREYLEDYATVGKTALIFPVKSDQTLSLKKAVKSTKSIYNYTPWPEIPKNNKFEHGTKLDTGVALDDNDLNGNGNTTEVIGRFENWTIDSWRYGWYSSFPFQNAALPALSATASTFYRHSVFNNFDVEIERYVVINEVTEGTRGVLFAEDFPVISGDKISISFDYKLSSGGTGTQQIAFIYLQTLGGIKYFLESQNTSSMSPFYWIEDDGGRFISRFYETAENWNRFTNINIGAPPIPANGTLYIGLITPGISGSKTYIKNFNVDYQPYVAGGFIQVKGEYRLTSQDAGYLDKSEEEIFISDNEHKIYKGTLLNSLGNPLTPSWYRMGMTETAPYTWFTNKGKFNHEYRRFRFVEGTFKGNLFAPSNDQENYQPLGFHKQYRLTDMEGDRRFMLTAPIDIDLGTGFITGKFHEVLADPTTHNQIESKLNLIQRLITAINNTTEAAWVSGTGSTPTTGTLGFPPIAEKGGLFTADDPDAFTVYINVADEMTASGTNILGEASPVITRTGNSILGSGPGVRVHVFKIDGILKDGDIFTMHAYGFNVAVQTMYVDVPFQNDGLQVGQTEFKYIF